MKKQVRAVSDGVGDAVFSQTDAGADVRGPFLLEQIGNMAKGSGFAYYLVAAFPLGDRNGFVANCIASNWPQELIALYDEVDLFHSCNLVSRLKRSVMPVFCDKMPFESTAANQKNQRLTTLFRDHGLKNTFAFALHDAELRQYIFAFSGDRADLRRDETMSQLFQAMEFLDVFARHNPVDRPPASLSGREIECLRWSAAGKSSDEIAIILNLSSHTVVGYLKSAIRKLESVNRMQAVARAFRYRLL